MVFATLKFRVRTMRRSVFIVSLLVALPSPAASAGAPASQRLTAPPPPWSTYRGSIESVWSSGVRDDSTHFSDARLRRFRTTAAGLATAASFGVITAGLSETGRRYGAASPAPMWGAASHFSHDLGFIIGASSLLSSALIASIPLEGGVRRLRPMPIGGRRWGGLAFRWRF